MAVAATAAWMWWGSTATAAPVKIFRAQTAQQFLAGTLENVGVDPLGALRLADRAERLVALEEPFLLAAAAHPQGWVVGTGNAGRVMLIDRQGKASVLFAAPEPEVFAVWSDPDGTVFAGTSPQGKVYRIAKGKGEEWFAPGEPYIWSLRRASDGALLVATGTQGKLYRVTGRGEGEVLYDSDDTHVRALHALPNGEALLGTAGEGLVVRLDAAGRARTLYDAEEPEIIGFAVTPDGTAYTAALRSEAGLGTPADPGREGKGGDKEEAPKEGKEEKGDAQVTVTVTAEGDSGAAAARGGQRSQVLRITPAGVVESVWTFDAETVYALGWHRDRLWVGTGLEGKLYSLQEGRMILEKDVDERQIVALAEDQPGPAFATTNAAALYRLVAGAERSGTYTSPALDAGQMARFGVFRWRGEAAEGGAVRLSFRSGVSAEPDRTWSAWTAARAGRELSLAELPTGRYVQWRAELASNGQAPRIVEAELSYRQENLAPRIARFTPMEPGQILVPANFNPGNQVYEPAHPARDGIFTTLEPSAEGEDARWKPLWKKGYRTLRWEASDPNGDDLRYALEFRPEERDDWMRVAEDLEDNHYSFDETVLPDGIYRFRLRASDSEANTDGGSLHAEQTSEPVVVDSTPPRQAGVRRTAGAVALEIEDSLSPLREAMVSVDGGEWRPAPTEDGLLDGRREVLKIERPTAARLVLVRVTDAANNVVTFDLSGGAP